LPGTTVLPTRLTLISSAATEAQRRAAFPLDEPLSDREKVKIAALGWNAPAVQRIVSGPERRVLQTAQALGLAGEVDRELCDCDYGAWTGRELSQIESDEPDGLAAWLTNPDAAPHGGESLLKLIARISQWPEGQRDAGSKLAITHSAVIRSVVLYALQAPPSAFWRIDIAPLSLTDLRFNGRAWTVRAAGCPLRRSAELDPPESAQ
jgi:broad specificity phosphatase PhoE